MFSDPLNVSYGASSSQSPFALLGTQAGNTIRKDNINSASGVIESTGTVLTIGAQDTKESPLAGGSTRRRISFSRTGSLTGAPEVNLTERVDLIIVQPKTGSTSTTVGQLLQMLVSFLVGDTDGSVSTDAALDATVLAKLLNGEG